MAKTLDKPRDKIDISVAFKLRYKNGLTFQEIADKFGVTKQAVHLALSSLTKHLPDAEEIEAYRQNKSQILEGVEKVLIDKMLDPDTVKSASLNNAAYAYQQISTQNRLEKGLATERIDSLSVTASLSELERRKADLLKCITIQDVVPDTSDVK